MPTQIFVNLLVKDLEKSKAFYEQLGFTINLQFTDKTAACVVISDNIYVMLLTYEKAKGFTSKEIVDAHKTTEVLNALSVESKNEVNELVDRAVKNGGSENGEPQTNYNDKWYGCGFEDLDGHKWNVFYNGK